MAFGSVLKSSDVASYGYLDIRMGFFVDFVYVFDLDGGLGPARDVGFCGLRGAGY
jgi:hypothetical protein